MTYVDNLVLSKDVIKVYENFVTDEDCKSICDFMYLRATQNRMYSRDNFFWTLGLIKNKKIHLILDKLAEQAIKEINYPNPLYIRDYVFNLMGTNASIGKHTDRSGNPEFTWTSVFYLNKVSDYEEGQIYFEELDLKLNPEKRTMITMPATILHEVLEVKKGGRYSLSVFFTEHKEYELFFEQPKNYNDKFNYWRNMDSDD